MKRLLKRLDFVFHDYRPTGIKINDKNGNFVGIIMKCRRTGKEIVITA